VTRCAVVGIGQTHHVAARRDVTMAGLVREAVTRALDDAALDGSGVDAVVLGKAPDVLEGVMSPELFLADALGAVGKPVVRAYTSGNAGGMAASTGVALVGSGRCARVLVVGFEKQSEGDRPRARRSSTSRSRPAGRVGRAACSPPSATSTSTVRALPRTSATSPR
jgi:acetyl-CoA C-acetyltransferase